jgi:transposase-like protein
MYIGLFATQKKRGLSLAALARESGIPAGTLSWWKKEIRRRADRRGSSPRPSFVPVTVRPASRPVTDAGFEILLPNDVRLRVPTAFDKNDLERLVATLVSAC